MKKVIKIKLRIVNPEIAEYGLGDTVAEYVEGKIQYGGLGFDEWSAIKSLAENMMQGKKTYENS